MTTDERTPTYRDGPLHKLIRQLRADVRTIPHAKKSLEKVEGRLKYILRVLESSDDAHAKRAELFLTLGLIPQANTEASLIWDESTRTTLLDRARIGTDQGGAEDRMVEALEMEREVLE